MIGLVKGRNPPVRPARHSLLTSISGPLRLHTFPCTRDLSALYCFSGSLNLLTASSTLD